MQATPAPPPFAYADEQFADVQLLRYRADGFERLTLRQKTLVYYLSQAALEGRDILYDQNGPFNLLVRRALEGVWQGYPGDRRSPAFRALETYLKRVWFSNGIHHHYAATKLEPGFPEDFLREALARTPRPLLPLREGETAGDLFRVLRPVIFDPAVMPRRVNRADGEDIVRTSSANYYRGVTRDEAEAYYAALRDPADPRPVMHGLNSRLVKREDGTLHEQVWKSGGLYGPAIDRILRWLEKACTVAENPAQEAVIRTLMQFYRDGSLRTFDDYSVRWLQDTASAVDFVNGFIESYGDPLGLKGSWESIVDFRDEEATRRARLVSAHAAWFEAHSPVDERFKKTEVRGVTAKVVTAAILGGDLYPSSAIGINLPNSDWIRGEHGSKSVTIGNLVDACRQAARGNGFREEFAYGPEELALLDRYADLTDTLHTDLHECLGHGSGRLLPGTGPDALRAYGSVIEEARADLFGLYYLPDPKLTELGLTPDGEAYKAEYYSFMMNGLMTQLARVAPGASLEEAHMRDRQLIARWAYEQGADEKVVELTTRPGRDGKTYVRVNDYPRLRALFGKLLAEVQRIKSEGDHEAARRLVEGYGVAVDPALHREVLQRYARLRLAPYKGFINPVYTPLTDAGGHITDIAVSYGEGYAEQMMRYSREYASLPDRNE